VKLVEQELWQKEEKGLIGILPVRDALEINSAGPTASQGDMLHLNKCLIEIKLGGEITLFLFGLQREGISN
jgi:hypothetical protein